MSIGAAYCRIRAQVPDQITIVLAAKTRTPAEVREAIGAGATHIGENYVQEADTMRAALGPLAETVTWHLLGPLQKNKINRALDLFDCIQTVDSLEKARAINSRAARRGKALPVLLEINIGREAAKAGLSPDAEHISTILTGMHQLSHLRPEGLMTMGPLTESPEALRPYFKKARAIFDAINALRLPGERLTTLSMGMSDSYRVAVEEGATMIRLGTVVFGSR